MIQVLHVSAECYPAAKTGGLGDVVGSLPKYLCSAGILSAAIIPKYSTKWIGNQHWTEVYAGSVRVEWWHRAFTVQQLTGNPLGYPLFVVDIPGLFDRPGIYNEAGGRPYGDEIERSIVFQQAVLQWLMSFEWFERPRVVHCHDHHTGMIPWMMKHCPEFEQLAPIPTIFTIHNGQYQGAFSMKNIRLLPYFKEWAGGLFEWNSTVNPMACAIKCAWAVSTVSQSYLYELHESSLGLESLLRQEWQKEWGILNGIDAEVWNPATDPMIAHRFDGDIAMFKRRNKAVICEWFGLSHSAPLVAFIGRIVHEKGTDILPDAFKQILHHDHATCFLVLGSGEHHTENQFREMNWHYGGKFNSVLEYNEALSHQIYAGADFLIMPSRVEPCGLNQFYSMRYGTIPIVRSIGGLKDTVPDIAEPGGVGRGIRFDQFSVADCAHAIHRAISMFHLNRDIVAGLRERIMGMDFSWEKTIESYLRMYRSVGADVKPEFPEVQSVPAEESKPKKTTTKKSTK